MWLVNGIFDNPPDQDPDITKTKLLKPGIAYKWGRAPDCDLRSLGKVFSHNEGLFKVDKGGGDEEPTLHYTSLSSKGRPLTREGNESRVLLTNEVVILKNGDKLPKGRLSIILEPMVVYAYRMNKAEVQRFSLRAAKIGVRVTRTYPPETTTHFLLDAYPSKPAECDFKVLTGLLTAVHIVTPEWLQRLLTLGELPKGSAEPNLEEEWRSFETEHRPKVEGSASDYTWDQLDERKDMLQTLRFVVLHDSVSLPSDLIALFKVGGAMFTAYSVVSETAAQTSDEWADYLKREKKRLRKSGGENEKVATALVALALDLDVMKDNLKNKWEDIYVNGANLLNMQIVSEEDLARAVLQADIDALHASRSSQSASFVLEPSLATSSKPKERPTVIPSTLGDEGSLGLDVATKADGEGESSSSKPRVVKRRLKSPVVPDPPQPVDPPPDIDPDEDSAPRRPLRKRAAPKKIADIIGFDDSLSVIDPSGTGGSESTKETQTRDKLPQADILMDLDAPLPPRRNLKRRAPVSREARLASMGVGDSMEVDGVSQSQTQEPPHKKFKLLFDENALDEGTGATLPQPKSQPVEDDEVARYGNGPNTQTQPFSQAQVAGRSKRKALEIVDEEEEMEVEMTEHTQTQSHASKRRAIEGTNSIQPTQSTSGSTAVRRIPSSQMSLATAQSSADIGAKKSGVEEDLKYLQAVASKTKGKRQENAFDREFNQLKISAPGKERSKNVQDDMDMESGGAANLMVIEFVDLFRKDGGRKENIRPNENGKPNFKKFKKKNIVRQGTQIEMQVSSGPDYGRGRGYWEPEKSPGVADETLALERTAPTQTQSRSGKNTASQAPPKKSRRLRVDTSSSEDDAPPPPKTKPKFAAKGKGKAKVVAEVDESDLEFGDEQRRRKPPSAQRQQGSGDESEDYARAIAAVGPDVSDDEISTLKSSAPKTRTQTTGTGRRSASVATSRAPSVAPSQRTTRGTAGTKKPRVVVIDSDSDDGMTFKSYKQKATRKK